MSWQSTTCSKCFNTYEFYQQRTWVPACPRCGGGVKGCAGIPVDPPYIDDDRRLSMPMGQFQNWYGKLFQHTGDFIGWRYVKGCV